MVEATDDHIARAVPIDTARTGPNRDQPLRRHEGERALDRGAVGHLDRRTLLGRSRHPQHGDGLARGQCAVLTGPVPRAGAANQRLAGAG